MAFEGDPIGYAIHDFSSSGEAEDITVQSDLCEDDILPTPYLFRTFEEMPAIEKFALAQCEGSVLDIGAAAGCHSKYLMSVGLQVKAVERSTGAFHHLSSIGINCELVDFMKLENQQFDTILLLMNGLGLAGSLDRLPSVLKKLKGLLKPGGKILADSTDIRYMYAQDDGSMLIDLNAEYFGEMQFNMIYKAVESGWFPWLYIDPLKLTEYAVQEGFEIEIVLEGDNNDYLAELKVE